MSRNGRDPACGAIGGELAPPCRRVPPAASEPACSGGGSSRSTWQQGCRCFLQARRGVHVDHHEHAVIGEHPAISRSTAWLYLIVDGVERRSRRSDVGRQARRLEPRTALGPNSAAPAAASMGRNVSPRTATEGAPTGSRRARYAADVRGGCAGHPAVRIARRRSRHSRRRAPS